MLASALVEILQSTNEWIQAKVIRRIQALEGDFQLQEFNSDFIDSMALYRKASISEHSFFLTGQMPIFTILRDKGVTDKQSAKSILIESGYDQEYVEWITSIFDHWQKEYGTIRGKAARSLGKLGVQTPEVMNALISALYYSDSCSSVAEALVQLGSSAPELSHTLVQMFRDNESAFRYYGIELFGKLKNPTPEVFSVLIEALENEDKDIRRDAVMALEHLGKRTPNIVNALFAKVKDVDSNVSFHAVIALERLGVANREKLDLLRALLESFADSNETQDLNWENWEAFVDQKLLGLTSMLHNQKVPLAVQLQAAKILRMSDRVPRDIMQVFIAALQDENPEIRRSAASELRYIGDDDPLLDTLTPDVIKILLNGVHDEDLEVRCNIIQAIGELERFIPNVLAILMVAIHDVIPEVRQEAISALQYLRGSKAKVITLWLEGLNDGDEMVRNVAKQSLGNLSFQTDTWVGFSQIELTGVANELNATLNETHDAETYNAIWGALWAVAGTLPATNQNQRT